MKEFETRGALKATSTFIDMSGNINSKPNNQPCNFNKELYEGVDLAILREAISREGIGLWIPRQYLFGTQTLEEYDPKKRKSIEEKLLSDGVKCLEQNPLLACAIPYNNSISVAIIDGHHKARYSSKYNIHALPCLVASPEVYVKIMKKCCPQKEIKTDSFVMKLEDETTAAIRSFSYRMQDKYSPPRLITGVSDTDQLKTIFDPFVRIAA